MIRTRGWLVAIVAFGLGATACKKDSDKTAASGDKTAEGSAKAAAPGDKTAPAAAGGAITGAVGDDLALLPVDSEAVVGINFGQVQQSALWKQFVAPRLATADLSELQKFKTLCGFDPLESFKSVSIGMKGLGGGDPSGAIVVHGFDKAKSMDCFQKHGADMEKDGSKATVDGDVVLITDKSGKKVGFTFINDSTALVVLGPEAASKDGIKKVAAGGSALKTSAAFTDMFSKIQTGDSLWMVINGNSPAFSKAAAMGVKFKALFGSINITDGLSVDFRFRFPTPDEASQFVTMAKSQTGNAQVKAMFDKLDVTADGVDAKLALAMSSEKLKALIQMVGGMMGGMMGGGAGGP